MGVCLLRIIAAVRIGKRAGGWDVVVVVDRLAGCIMVAERHADAGANRRHALYGHSEGDHQHEQQTLDLDHGAGESYHGSGTPLRYRLFPDSVRSAKFPRKKSLAALAVAAAGIDIERFRG